MATYVTRNQVSAARLYVKLRKLRGEPVAPGMAALAAVPLTPTTERGEPRGEPAPSTS